MTSYTTFIKHSEKVMKNASASRPVLKGAHHSADGSVYVTDSTRLYKLTGATATNEPYTLDTKTGKHIDGNYPDCERLLPDSDGALLVATITNVADALLYVKSLATIEKKQSDTKHATFRFTRDQSDNLIIEKLSTNPVSYQFNISSELSGDVTPKINIQAQYIVDALALFKDAGEDDITFEYYGDMRPATLKSDDVTILLMPVRTY